jgi:DNA ligase-1
VKAFTDLYTALDETTKTNEKIDALTRYFSTAPARDAAWALYFLSGRKPRQVVGTRKLHLWALEVTGIPEWLFSESYDAVGDIAETIALLLPPPREVCDFSLAYWVEERLIPLRGKSEDAQREVILEAWRTLDQAQRFVWN